MKVKELVEMLLEVDQEAEVLIDCRHLDILVDQEVGEDWFGDGTEVVHLTT